MSKKNLSIKCFLALSFILITFPRKIHLASLKISEGILQDTTSNTNSLDHEVYPGVEVSKEIQNDTEQTQIIKTKKHKLGLLVPEDLGNSVSERGFNLTKDEMEKFKIWPYGIIPYYIDDFSFDTVYSERLRTLLNGVNTVTGLRFIELTEPPKDDREKWVFFINRRGLLSCEDYTTTSFTNVGVQRVVLGYDCLGAGGGALAATVLALAGVPPQHNAPDRDKHINVMMDNVIPEKRKLFQVLKDDEWLFHDIGYDFLSASHFDFHKYTCNGSATIVPKEEVNVPVGEGDGISYKDILKIQMLYNYIKRRSPKAKASDCSKLYKPAANFHDFKPSNDKDNIKPRDKPIKYLKASGSNNYTEQKTEESDAITDSGKLLKRPILPKKKLNITNKKKSLLESLPDFNTD